MGVRSTSPADSFSLSLSFTLSLLRDLLLSLDNSHDDDDNADRSAPLHDDRVYDDDDDGSTGASCRAVAESYPQYEHDDESEVLA